MRKTYPTLLRCYARPEADHYIGQCLELDLAVQGESLQEVRRKMEECLQSYLESLDRENVRDLFPRPAPLHVWCDYYRVCFLVLLHRLLRRLETNVQVFREQVIPQRFAIHPVG
jgi:predicted RNase H-like HicB family nuclease